MPKEEITNEELMEYLIALGRSEEEAIKMINSPACFAYKSQVVTYIHNIRNIMNDPQYDVLEHLRNENKQQGRNR